MWSNCGQSSSVSRSTSGPGQSTCAATGLEPSWTSSPKSGQATAGLALARRLDVPRQGVFLPGVDKAAAAAAPPEFRAPAPTAVWQLGVDTGRLYAAVSGDFNPIHLSLLSAKALGLPRSIAHGMYLASRALADVGSVKSEAFRWDVNFEAPVFLPARVALEIGTVHSASGSWERSDYVAWNPRSGRRHFSGSVTAL
ncbi:maoc domain protein dehydratase [Arthrobacter sp. Hiyo8]|nr:maoc domain protein dehydratase [Arthrobacter sp. Hiyo8]